MATTQRLRRRLERDGVPAHVNLTESFCRYGTPLPSLLDHKKDKNEWKPLWQQEAYDEKGRRRFHGAFTGGWSAGYFNTVGSKEGWTPSSFRSSRTSRQDASQIKSRPEDFMDDEDLEAWRGSQPLQTTQAYASQDQTDPLLSILTPATSTTGSSLGTTLLQRMGWKPGQGIGPLCTYHQRAHLVRTLERMHLAPPHLRCEDPAAPRSHLKFPPPDTQTLSIPSHRDRHGVGSAPATRASALQDALHQFHHGTSDDEENVNDTPIPTLPPQTDSLVVGETPTTSSTWPDGRSLPAMCTIAVAPWPSEPIWPAPPVPSDWTPDPTRVWRTKPTSAQTKPPTTADERAFMLGEARAPGAPPSLSSYLSAQAQARHGLRKHTPITVHRIDAETARRALDAFRSTGHDTEKEARYCAYLRAFQQDQPFDTSSSTQDELDDFFQTASRHRPVHGDMAQRFTTSTMLQDETLPSGLHKPTSTSLAATAEPKASRSPSPPASAAQLAARNGEFGPLTRTVDLFYPPRLLCKRLGIADPHPEREETSVAEAAPLAPTPTPLDTETPGFVFAPISEAQQSAQEHAWKEARPPVDVFKAVFASDDDDRDDNGNDELGPSETAQTSLAVPPKRKATSHTKKKKKRTTTGPLTFDLGDDDDGAARSL